MMDILARRFKISPDAVDSAVGKEIVLLFLTDGAYYGLDEVGAAIWKLLKAGTEPEEICAVVADEYQVDRSTVDADVRVLLAELEAKGIIGDA
jgi:hypothetical protein